MESSFNVLILIRACGHLKNSTLKEVCLPGIGAQPRNSAVAEVGAVGMARIAFAKQLGRFAAAGGETFTPPHFVKAATIALITQQ
jgi:hypothetical protein